MSIEVNCKKCGAAHSVNDRLAGRSLHCPHCDSPVVVPAIAKAVEAADAVAELDDADLLLDQDSETFAVDSADDVSTTVTANDEDQRPGSSDDNDDDNVLPARVKPEEGELDMTPMVDVTFLLLIFFMITAAFSLQKSIESPRQTSDAASSQPQEEPPEELDMVTVQINEFGSFLVMAPDWERETPGKQNLIRALREAMGDGTTAMKLAIEVHEMARLKSLVDCMDAGTICDYGEMQVIQVEGFE